MNGFSFGFFVTILYEHTTLNLRYETQLNVFDHRNIDCADLYGTLVQSVLEADVRRCMIEASVCTPLMNSDIDRFPSWFLSILRKISLVFSSADRPFLLSVVILFIAYKVCWKVSEGFVDFEISLSISLFRKAYKIVVHRRKKKSVLLINQSMLNLGHLTKINVIDKFWMKKNIDIIVMANNTKGFLIVRVHNSFMICNPLVEIVG